MTRAGRRRSRSTVWTRPTSCSTPATVSRSRSAPTRTAAVTPGSTWTGAGRRRPACDSRCPSCCAFPQRRATGTRAATGPPRRPSRRWPVARCASSALRGPGWSAACCGCRPALRRTTVRVRRSGRDGVPGGARRSRSSRRPAPRRTACTGSSAVTRGGSRRATWSWRSRRSRWRCSVCGWSSTSSPGPRSPGRTCGCRSPTCRRSRGPTWTCRTGPCPAGSPPSSAAAGTGCRCSWRSASRSPRSGGAGRPVGPGPTATTRPEATTRPTATT